jgi:phenylacetate-CoA ligase
VLGTALAQLHYGFALVSGRRVRVRDVERLVADIAATRAEFGQIGDLGAFRGTSLSPQDRRPIDNRRLRRLARMAYDGTAYYRWRFDRARVAPEQLDLATLSDFPVTPKEALRDLPEAFVNRRAEPRFRAETTGTTGPPTAVWFSRYEIDLATAMTAVSYLIDFGLDSTDVVQLSLNSRAAVGIQCLMRAAELVGAASYSLGLVDPEVGLSGLTGTAHLPGKQPQPTLLVTYSSYLGLLVDWAEKSGYTASDFGLEHIMCGGEIVTDGLRRRAERLFGAKVVETYGMTEISPANGQVCRQGHLHFNPEQGVTEVLDFDGTRSVEPGETGELTFTPACPYRETTLLLRFSSGDVVRCLADGSLDCELARLPATSRLLGKRAQIRDIAGRQVTPRDVLELIEDDPAAPLPSRWALVEAGDGFDLYVLGHDRDGFAERVGQRAATHGLPLRRVVVSTDLSLMPPTSPVRADLREPAFRNLPHPATTARLESGVLR